MGCQIPIPPARCPNLAFSIEADSTTQSKFPLVARYPPHTALPHTLSSPIRPPPQTPTSRVPNTGHFSTPRLKRPSSPPLAPKSPSRQQPIPQIPKIPPNPRSDNIPVPPRTKRCSQFPFAHPPRPAHARAQRTPKHPSAAQRTSMKWPAFDSTGLSNGLARNLSETAQGGAMRSNRQRQTRGAQPAVQGPITSSPIPSKASTSLVATAAPQQWAIAAIWQSA